MVIDGFNREASEEPHSLTDCHACAKGGDGRAERFKNEAIQWVVLEGAVGIGHVEAVMSSVNGSVEKFVHVHEAVKKYCHVSTINMPSVNWIMGMTMW